MSIKIYIDPQKKEHRGIPDSVRLLSGQTVSIPKDCTDEMWLEIGTCLIRLDPDPVVVENPVFTISKLSLRRTLRELGLEQLFNDALHADQQIADDWADATELRSDDPMLLAAIDPISEAAGMTVEEALELLRSVAI